jgi:formylglycine-generating enzyme required for sulfatase activity
VRKLNEVVPAGGFRLPTEAEWEFAAKAGGAPLDGNLPAVAWFDAPEQSFAPRPVGSKAPGKFGLHDMLGNVWEWCTDQYSPYPGADGGEVAADSNLRVLRGGGFADSADLLNPAMRHGSLRDRRLRWNGLRIARSVPVR